MGLLRGLRFHLRQVVVPRDAGGVEEICQQAEAVLREDRLRVKLHSVQPVGAMLERHDRAVVVAGRHDEAARQRAGVDHERMIAAGNHRAWDAREEIQRVVVHGARAAMHRLAGTDDPRAQCRGDRLMAEADTEHGHAAAEGLHGGDGAAGLCRSARPR